MLSRASSRLNALARLRRARLRASARMSPAPPRRAAARRRARRAPPRPPRLPRAPRRARRALPSSDNDRRDELERRRRRRRAPARRSASGSRRRAPRPPRAPRRAPRRPPDRRSRDRRRATRSSSVADLDGDDALARRRHAGLDRQRERDAVARTRAAAARPPPGRAHRTRPASSLRSRVSRLPRIGAKRAPGKQPRQLSDAPHAARADRRRLAERGHEHRRASGDGSGPSPACRPAAPPRRADLRAAGRRRCQAVGQTAGMSLLLCTARSMSPPSSASSISFTNSRLPPTSESGASCSRSPEVLMTTMRHGGPPASAMRRRDGVAPARARAGCRACRVAARQARRMVSARPDDGFDLGRTASTRRAASAASVGSSGVGARARRRSRGRTGASAPRSTRRPCPDRRAP